MSESLIQDLQAKLNSAEAARRRLEEENKVFFFFFKEEYYIVFICNHGCKLAFKWHLLLRLLESWVGKC